MSRLLVSRLLDDYCADRRAVVAMPDRVDSTSDRLRARLGELGVNELTRATLLDYTEARVGDGVQPQTARRELATLRAALRMAWRDGRIDRVPHVPLPPRGPRRERVLSGAEVRRLLSATAAWPRAHCYLRLLVGTCGRATAICELTWNRVDLDGRVIDLRAPHPLAARRKGRAVVPIGDDLATYLQSYRNWPGEGRRRGRRPEPGMRVVGVSSACARRQLAAAACVARVDGVTPHVIRHSVATQMLRSGVPLHVVSRMLGHASVAITADIYGHLVTRDLQPAAAVLEQWAQG